MKNMYFKMCSLLLVAFLLSSSLYAGGDKDKVKKKISELNKKMAEQMSSGNMEAMLDYYTEDAISLPSYSKMNKGLDAIKAHYEAEKETMPKFSDVQFETVEVLGQEDLFVEIGTYKLTMEMKNMEKPMTDVGKYITVWKMLPDGSLKIQADTWNTDINYMEMDMAGEQKETDTEMTGGKK